jgi:hypothetical protein
VDKYGLIGTNNFVDCLSQQSCGAEKRMKAFPTMPALIESLVHDLTISATSLASSSIVVAGQSHLNTPIKNTQEIGMVPHQLSLILDQARREWEMLDHPDFAKSGMTDVSFEG